MKNRKIARHWFDQVSSIFFSGSNFRIKGTYRRIYTVRGCMFVTNGGKYNTAYVIPYSVHVSCACCFAETCGGPLLHTKLFGDNDRQSCLKSEWENGQFETGKNAMPRRYTIIWSLAKALTGVLFSIVFLILWKHIAKLFWKKFRLSFLWRVQQFVVSSR